jgi:hypothetical protein
MISNDGFYEYLTDRMSDAATIGQPLAASPWRPALGGQPLAAIAATSLLRR